MALLVMESSLCSHGRDVGCFWLDSVKPIGCRKGGHKMTSCIAWKACSDGILGVYFHHAPALAGPAGALNVSVVLERCRGA
jgi:hypothetical protein